MSKTNDVPTEKLFGSKTRAKLLELFFSNPSTSYYVREITRVIEEQINSVRRELINLQNIGIIKSETYDNKIYYSANRRHAFCRPLTDMFSKKTSVNINHEPVPDVWEEYIRPIRKYLSALLVTNRVPGEEGIDMLIIGDDSTKKLTSWAELVEKKQGKPMNYVIMTPEDFSYRKSVRDRFVLDILDLAVMKRIDPENIIQSK